MIDSVAGPLPDAGRVASALGATWALLAETLEQGWARHDDGIYTLVTGVPIASLNGVWVVGEEVDADVVAASLASVAESRVPFCLEARRRGGSRARPSPPRANWPSPPTSP